MSELAAPRRGELYWVDFSPGRGSEAGGRRPAVIVQCDPGNVSSAYPNTIILAVSSQGHEIPQHVRLRPSRLNGLKNNSFIKCEQILTIAKERLGPRIGRLTPAELQQVNEAVRRNLALDDASNLH